MPVYTITDLPSPARWCESPCLDGSQLKGGRARCLSSPSLGREEITLFPGTPATTGDQMPTQHLLWEAPSAGASLQIHFFGGGRPDVHSFCSQTFPTASGDAPWTKSCSITSVPSQGTQPGQTSPCPCLGLGEQPPILPVALNLHLMQVSPSR